MAPRPSSEVQLDARIDGNRVIVPLGDLSHKERTTSVATVKSQLGRQASVDLTDDNVLICTVVVNSSRHRDSATRSIQRRVCSIIRQAVHQLRERHARQGQTCTTRTRRFAPNQPGKVVHQN